MVVGLDRRLAKPFGHIDPSDPLEPLDDIDDDGLAKLRFLEVSARREAEALFASPS
ncbi:MAG: hypothetical protein IPG04_08295 [Polyangiaceae bacterium]|nr:hypothetical protein [Polyangiaceae bacterium]